MVLKRMIHRNSLFVLLLLVLATNFTLYHTSFGNTILPKNTIYIVLGSMIDLTLVVPILFITWLRKWNWKNIVIAMAGGLIVVRFLIPMEYLAPFAKVTWVGFGIEAGLIVAESFVLISLFIYLPRIIRTVNQNSSPVIFAFPHAVEKHVKDAPIIKIICSELLMFYYAFASWKKKPRIDDQQFTLHQKTSLIALQAMMIHAIVLESIGIHWWLHGKFFILSIILLIGNIYSVILLIADIQAVRLNPLKITKDRMYVSLGLMKRMEIKWNDIEELIEDNDVLKQKLATDTIEFIARDFETVYPDVILKLKRPVDATFLLGLRKKYTKVAIRVDDPNKFIETLKQKIAN